MTIQYVKADGKYYYPQDAGAVAGIGFKPICEITVLTDGRVQIDFYSDKTYFKKKGYCRSGLEAKVNTRIVLYPKLIEEIKYIL